MAVTAAVPEIVARNVDVHVAAAVVPLRLQVVKVPPVIPVSDSATVPVGVMKVPAELSVTVTVQVDPWLATTGVVQLTDTVVVRGLTTMLAVPLLPL